MDQQRRSRTKSVVEILSIGSGLDRNLLPSYATDSGIR